MSAWQVTYKTRGGQFEQITHLGGPRIEQAIHGILAVWRLSEEPPYPFTMEVEHCECAEICRPKLLRGEKP